MKDKTKENEKEKIKKSEAKDEEIMLLNKTNFTLDIEGSHIWLAMCEGGFTELGNDFRDNFEEIDFGYIYKLNFDNLKFGSAKKCPKYKERVDIIIENPIIKIWRTKEGELNIIGYEK